MAGRPKMADLHKAIAAIDQDKANDVVFKYEEISDELASQLTSSRNTLVRDDLEQADKIAAKLVELDNLTSSPDSEELRNRRELVIKLERNLERIRYSLGLSQELIDPSPPKPIEIIDDSPIQHDPKNHEKLKYTPLDQAIVAEFDRTVEFLMSEYPGYLNYSAVQAYLRTKQADTIGDLSKVGLFMIIEFPPGSGIYRCQLWEFSDSLAHLKSKKLQMAQIKLLVDRYLVRHVFENTDDFFVKKPSLTTRMKQKWPWLSSIF